MPGTTYELGGPQISTLRQIITFILSVIGRKRYLVPLSFKSAASIAFITEAIHKLSFKGPFPESFMITSDQVKLLREDNIVSPLADHEVRREVQHLECFEPYRIFSSPPEPHSHLRNPAERRRGKD